MTTLDAVVVGAGQAGLGVSYYLQQAGHSHVVFERGQVGETWLTQRWDTFCVNTPNFMNALPGLPYNGPEPNGFAPQAELVDYYRRYADHFRLPVRTGKEVVAVDQAPGETDFSVQTRAAGQADERVTGRCVVIAAGIQNVPNIPALREKLPQGITQLHTAAYRSAAALPPGAVVVVGSGQSGCQIVEDLLAAGRSVYLCTSRVGRAPRRYRGRDLLTWWVDMQHLEVTFTSLPDKSISRAAQPQISGVGPRGHTVSLQHLARAGVTILGRLLDVTGDALVLGDDAAANVRFADGLSQQLKDGVDAYLARAGLTPPPLEPDLADEPDPAAECVSPLRRLDLRAAGVSTVIWATGFTGDFSWLHLPAFSPDGAPLHQMGVSPVRGLFWLGLPWLTSRKSGIIYGISGDARLIAEAVAKLAS